MLSYIWVSVRGALARFSFSERGNNIVSFDEKVLFGGNRWRDW